MRDPSFSKVTDSCLGGKSFSALFDIIGLNF